MFLKTSGGPVRSIMWGDHLSLQHDLRDPLHAYFENPRSPAIELTMWPSRWVDPGGDADYRFVRKAPPVRLVAHGMVIVGLIYWLAVPWQLLMLVVRGNRSNDRRG